MSLPYARAIWKSGGMRAAEFEYHTGEIAFPPTGIISSAAEPRQCPSQELRWWLEGFEEMWKELDEGSD